MKEIIYFYLTYSNFLKQSSGFSGLITIWHSSSQWRIGSLSCSSQSMSSTVSTARRVSDCSALQLDSPWLRLSSYWLTALLCDWLSSCSIASTTSCPLYHCKPHTTSPHTSYKPYQLDSLWLGLSFVWFMALLYCSELSSCSITSTMPTPWSLNVL